MNRAEVARGFGWNVFFGLINKAIFPILGILIARILGPSQLGIYITILSIVTVTEIFRDAGLGVTYIADPKSPDDEGVYVSLSLAFGLAIGLVLFLGKAALARFFDMPELEWGLMMAAIAVALNGLATIPANKLQKQARFKEAGLADTSASLVAYGVAIPIILAGFGFVGLVWHMAARAALYLAFTLYLARIKAPSWQSSSGKRILKLSFSAMLNNLAYTIYTLGDRAVIAKLFDAKAVGQYGAAYNVAVKPLDFFTFPLGRTLLVAFSHASEDRKRLAHIFARSIAAVFLFSVPIYGFFALYAAPIMVGLYGNSFRAAAWPFTLLSVYLFARSFGNLAGNAVFALGKPALNVISWIPGYLIAGLGIWLMRDSITLNSATFWIALGAVAVYCTNTAFALSLLKPEREDLSRIGRALALGSVSLVAAGMIWVLPVNVWIRLALGLAAVGCVQAALVGWNYASDWRAALSKNGLKAIWQSL